MASDDRVRYEPGRVARVVMNRPQYRNAQSAQLLEELDAAFADADRDRSVRVIVLAGEGQAFSAGHDLGTPEHLAWKEAHTIEASPTEVNFAYSWEHFVTYALRWRDLSKPTIAEVHGWCIFGGWLVASAMDLIVAADDARFLTALLQFFRLPYDVGARKAKELLFDNREISASEAAELGFVSRVVPRAELTDQTMALAERIAANNPFYLRMVKQAVNGSEDAMGLRNAVVAAHAHYQLSQTADEQWARRRGGADAGTAGRRRLPLVERVLGDESAQGRPAGAGGGGDEPR